MGYTTEFYGCFSLNKKLDEDTFNFLTKLSRTRRMKRDLPPEYGIDGEFYVDGGGQFGQAKETSIVNYNSPPSTQPGLWCQWTPSTDGQSIIWDGGEKFYYYIPWIEYIISRVLVPRGYILNGTVKYQGEDPTDFGKIIINDNIVTDSQRAQVYL